MATQSTNPQQFVFYMNDKKQVALQAYSVTGTKTQQAQMAINQAQQDLHGQVGEISTQGAHLEGQKQYTNLSAMRLKLNTANGICYVESMFQGSKNFKTAGPHPDWIYYGKTNNEMFEHRQNPFEAQKQAKQLQRAGQGFNGFNVDGFAFPGEPKTWFYNYTYCKAISQNPHLDKLVKTTQGFNDAYFNPKYSLNCQAQACAIYHTLDQRGQLKEALSSASNFKKLVYDSDLLPENQTTATAKPVTTPVEPTPDVTTQTIDSKTPKIFISGSMNYTPTGQDADLLHQQFASIRKQNAKVIMGDSYLGIDKFAIHDFMDANYQNVHMGTLEKRPLEFGAKRQVDNHSWAMTQVVPQGNSGREHQMTKDRWMGQQADISVGVLQPVNKYGHLSKGTVRNMIQAVHTQKPALLYYVKDDRLKFQTLKQMSDLDTVMNSYQNPQITQEYEQLKTQEIARLDAKTPIETFKNHDTQPSDAKIDNRGQTPGNAAVNSILQPVVNTPATAGYAVKTDIANDQLDCDQNRMYVALNHFKTLSNVGLYEGFKQLNAEHTTPDDTSYQSVLKLGQKIPTIQRAIDNQQIDENRWNAAMQTTNQEFKTAKQQQIAILTPLSPQYPQNELQVADKSYFNVIYAKGNLKALNADRMGAFIGPQDRNRERKNNANLGQSRAGEQLGVGIGKKFIKQGTVLVGGLANGVDATGYHLALALNQPTVQIVSSPLDHLDEVYPKDNQKDVQMILDHHGCIASLEPLNQSYEQRHTDFAAKLTTRDTLQSGMSDFVFAVEGNAQSGTMHALRNARVQGRPTATVDWPKYLNDAKLKPMMDDTKPQTYAWSKMAPYDNAHQFEQTPVINLNAPARPQNLDNLSGVLDLVQTGDTVPINQDNIDDFLNAVDTSHKIRRQKNFNPVNVNNTQKIFRQLNGKSIEASHPKSKAQQKADAKLNQLADDDFGFD